MPQRSMTQKKLDAAYARLTHLLQGYFGHSIPTPTQLEDTSTILDFVEYLRLYIDPIPETVQKLNHLSRETIEEIKLASIRLDLNEYSTCVGIAFVYFCDLLPEHKIELLSVNGLPYIAVEHNESLSALSSQTPSNKIIISDFTHDTLYELNDSELSSTFTSSHAETQLICTSK